MSKENRNRKERISSFKTKNKKPKVMGRTAKRATTWTIILATTAGAFTGMYFWGKNAGNATKPVRGILIPTGKRWGDSSIFTAVERESKMLNREYTGVELGLNVVEADGDIYSFIKAGTHDFAWTTHSTWLEDVRNDMTDRGSHDPDIEKQQVEFISLIARNSLSWDAPDVNHPEGESFVPTKAFTWDEIREDQVDAIEMKNDMEVFSAEKGGDWKEEEPGARSGYYRAQVFINEYGSRFWYTDGLTDAQAKDPNRPINKFLVDGVIPNNTYVATNTIDYITSGRSYLLNNNSYADRTQIVNAIANGEGWDVMFAYLDGIFNEAYSKPVGDELDLRDLFYLVDLRKEDAKHFTDLSDANKFKAEQKFISAYTSVTSFPNHIGFMPIFENLFDWEGFVDDKGFEAGTINGEEKTAVEIAQFETLYNIDFVNRDDTFYFKNGSSTMNIMTGDTLMGGQYAGYRQQSGNARDWSDRQFIIDSSNPSQEEIDARNFAYFQNNYNNTPAIAYSAVTWNEGFVIKKNLSDARRAIVLDMIDFMVNNNEVIGELPKYLPDDSIDRDDDGNIITVPWRVNNLFWNYYYARNPVSVSDSYWTQKIIDGEL